MTYAIHENGSQEVRLQLEKTYPLTVGGGASPDRATPASCISGIDCRNGTLTGGVTHTLQVKASGGISLNCTPSVLIVDNHPQDSRVTLNNTGVVQTLSAQMGLGGGNTPMIMYCPTRYAEYEETNPTLRASGGDIGGEVKD